MADYTELAPNLNNLRLTEADPTGAESAAKLNDAIVQTRKFIVDFLGLLMTDAGELKPAAIGGGTIPAGTIRGTNPIGSVEREIDQRSIQAIDIALLAVSSAELADSAVTTNKILALAVTSDKIAAGAITATKIQDNSITIDKLVLSSITGSALADGAITTAKIVDGNVTTAKIANRAVDGTKLEAAPVGYMMVGGNTVNSVPNCFAPRAISGALSLDADGLFSLAADLGDTTGFAVVAEYGANGTNAGGASANTWHMRGVNVPWVVLFDGANMMNANGSKVEFKKNGVYRIEVSSPALEVACHQIKMTVKKDAISSDTQVYYGTSEQNNSGTPSTTRSSLVVIQAFTGATPTLFPYIQVEHWTQTLKNTNGLGATCGTHASRAGAPDIFAVVNIFKLI